MYNVSMFKSEVMLQLLDESDMIAGKFPRLIYIWNLFRNDVIINITLMKTRYDIFNTIFDSFINEKLCRF